MVRPIPRWGEAAASTQLGCVDHPPVHPFIDLQNRCPACLSADSDEFVLFLQDAMPPLLSSSINGGAGGRTQALRAVEGLLPSDQALYLYTHKVGFEFGAVL